MTSDQWIYYIVLFCALVLFWLAWNLARHRPGRAMRAIRDGEVAAAASGINVAGYKTLAFGISAFYAGTAGSLFALSTGFVSPDTFPVSLSIQLPFGALGGGTPTSQTDVGITSNSILLGNTIAQSGPAAAYGTIGNAELAYFTYVNNNQGGVNGRKITFKILDDAYNPAQTITQTKQLVESAQVFAMFSGLGTQAQTSVREYLNGKKVPQLFVATGATTF